MTKMLLKKVLLQKRRYIKMSDFKKQFDELQEEINNKKLERAKLEERLANLQKEEKENLEELKELDITPDKLEGVIEKLEKEIREEMEICNKKLNN